MSCDVDENKSRLGLSRLVSHEDPTNDEESILPAGLSFAAYISLLLSKKCRLAWPGIRVSGST